MISTRKTTVMKHRIGTDGIRILWAKWACKNARDILHIGLKARVACTKITIRDQINLRLAQSALRSQQHRHGETYKKNKPSHGDSLNHVGE